MNDKTTGLFSDYIAGRMSRRELMTRAGKLGLGAAATGMMLSRAQTQAMAANFDWQKEKGKAIKLLLNKHPYTERDADGHREFQEAHRARGHL